ncbi:MAG: type III pantothenate kinase [Planctomycetota bacterium]|nr:MAG: type III pantothenate kinase [Planctomycetota bacterium]
MPRPSICLGDTVLLADVGNSRIKLAVVEDHGFSMAGGARRLPTVGQRRDIDSRGLRTAQLRDWLRTAAPSAAVILVASVHDAAAGVLEMALAEESATGHRPLRQRRVGHHDLPLMIDLAEPHRVGIDRLAAATAAALIKPAGQGAIVVDCGTAATVDMLSADGRFLGGAILPGPTLMARALAEGTSKLPEVKALEHADPPAMPGRNTQEAIAAGIGWGIRGAIGRLVAAARQSLGEGTPVILTGGWRAAVRDAVPGAIEMPDLVLAGIAMAAERACGR